MLICFNSQGTNSSPPKPASTTNAPRFPNVANKPAWPVSAWAPPNCTSEVKSVSITTATMSSSTETPIASCPARSWFAPVSCKIFPMIADDDTISMPARKSPSVVPQPNVVLNSRVR